MGSADRRRNSFFNGLLGGQPAGDARCRNIMLPLFEAILALIIAFALTAILVYPLRRRGPGPLDGLVFFVLVLFLAAWAGGVWARPVGPTAWGVAWVGFLMAGLLLATILAATTPTRPPAAAEVEPKEGEVAAEAIALGLGLFFYLAIFGLLVAIVIHYLAPMAA